MPPRKHPPTSVLVHATAHEGQAQLARCVTSREPDATFEVVPPAKVPVMEAIPLRSLLPDDFDPTQYKVHFAVWNQIKHPIDVLASSPEEWQGWNSWRSANNDFNRQFIFSVAQDKHDATHWLFGGIWEVLERRPEPHASLVLSDAT